MSNILAAQRVPESITSIAFKSAMRRFASSVTIITSCCNGVMNGMTATAVCSVSAEPPSILVVVNCANRSHALIAHSGAYVVNVLSGAQEALAGHFAASSTEDLFTLVPHSFGLTECPIIEGCVSYMECVVESKIDFATHSIFVGRVIASRDLERVPLLYHGGDFVRLDPQR
jgi:flavin reductase